MERIRVNAGRPYDVIIEKGSLWADKQGTKGYCVVTDSNVGPLYLERLKRVLGDGIPAFQFEAGESSKKPETVIKLVEFMAEKGMQRGDALIALGGGVTGDITGFAASVYMRGIEYIQIPTSLLAMVDSSVGGKTGVDIAAGKNLMGSFWQPSVVKCDVELLDTLPEENYLDGMAEVVKDGAISDGDFFAKLEKSKGADSQPWRLQDEEAVIKRCIEIKANIVEEDERENGRRAILNFGHTIGHAMEKCSNYKISHGRAVAMGMILMSRGAYGTNLTDKDYSTLIEEKLINLGILDKAWQTQELNRMLNSDEFMEAILADKKRVGNKIKLIVLDGIGKARIEEVSSIKVKEIIESGIKG